MVDLGFPIISLLIGFPIIGGLLVYFVGKAGTKAVKIYALAIALVEILLSLVAYGLILSNWASQKNKSEEL